MICWGLGGFGLGLTGPLETNTKEDMGAHAQLIVLWGANLAEPAEHRPRTWWPRAGAAPTWSRSTCARPKRPRSRTRC